MHCIYLVVREMEKIKIGKGRLGGNFKNQRIKEGLTEKEIFK